MSSARRLQPRRPSHGSAWCPQTLRESYQFSAAGNGGGRGSRREAFRPPNLYCRLFDETIGRGLVSPFQILTWPPTGHYPSQTPVALKSIQCKSVREIHGKRLANRSHQKIQT